MTLRTFMRSRLMAMEAPPILNTHLTTARASAASWLAVAARTALPKWFDGKIHYIIEIHYFMSTFLPFSCLLQNILRFHGFHFWIVHNLEIAFYFLSSQEFAPSSLGQRRGRAHGELAGCSSVSDTSLPKRFDRKLQKFMITFITSLKYTSNVNFSSSFFPFAKYT